MWEGLPGREDISLDHPRRLIEMKVSGNRNLSAGLMVIKQAHVTVTLVSMTLQMEALTTFPICIGFDFLKDEARALTTKISWRIEKCTISIRGEEAGSLHFLASFSGIKIISYYHMWVDVVVCYCLLACLLGFL